MANKGRTDKNKSYISMRSRREATRNMSGNEDKGVVRAKTLYPELLRHHSVDDRLQKNFLGSERWAAWEQTDNAAGLARRLLRPTAKPNTR